MNSKFLGIGCGVLAGALWGLVFLAPELARDFSPLQLAAGRYVAYGVIAAGLLLPRWHILIAKVGRRAWMSLFWLSLAGNIFYYLLLASAVQLGGMAMTSLVIGFLPVAVTIIGSRDADAAPFRRLLPSLVMASAGILCIGYQSLAGGDAGREGSAIGLLCAVGALVSWTLYAVGNSRALSRVTHLSAHDWSLLTGVVTGAQALLLVPAAFALEQHSQTAEQWLRFAGVVGSVALFASIMGNALWNRMSRLLPLTLAGQMILFETLFALLYGFVWEQRLPTALELLAIGLVTVSVLTCVSAHRAEPA